CKLAATKDLYLFGFKYHIDQHGDQILAQRADMIEVGKRSREAALSGFDHGSERGGGSRLQFPPAIRCMHRFAFDDALAERNRDLRAALAPGFFSDLHTVKSQSFHHIAHSGFWFLVPRSWFVVSG